MKVNECCDRACELAKVLLVNSVVALHEISVWSARRKKSQQSCVLTFTWSW